MVKIVRCFITIFIMIVFTLNTHSVWAAKLALVIDDFGYRQHNEEQVIRLSPNITVAVLPNSPNAARIANIAHQHGNDVIIHLPMAPLSKQRLEKDTLFPSMDETQISRIVNNAIELVPHAIGFNNHMGSLMTADLNGMTNVMKALSAHPMFFLDSKTIGRTQIKKAASYYDVPVLARDVFLDDEQTERAISRQFDLAVKLARKKGVAIVIGHPHPQTINVLKAKLAKLPADIELVKVGKLVTSSPNATNYPAKYQRILKNIADKCQNIIDKCKERFEELSTLATENE
ncbi:hypothetical protein A9G28_02170 [Gilliamella sp. Fer1-1]|jgi:uncharacterized protein|nr:hypothetical protein A9G28_02170 [Gilliamella apicola]